MYTLSPETIKYADRLAAEEYCIPELTLMKNAAKGCFDYIEKCITGEDKTVILCGKGNNGGDGYEIASLMKLSGYDVTVINVFDCAPGTETAKAVYKECSENGVSVVSLTSGYEAINTASVIIDALFGIGFYGSIDKESDIGKVIDLCNSLDALRIAIDTPSGINSADGRCDGVAFKANFTLTMAFIKTGMLSYPAKEYCGETEVVNIGYPEELNERIPKDALVADRRYLIEVLPERKANTHKGSYGRLLMYCASFNMTGAAILAATGALRSGCGLVNIARDERTLDILKRHLTEPIFSEISDDNKVNEVLSLSRKATAVLIGCGLGREKSDRDVLYSLIKNADCNLIIDADGINLLCENKHILREAKKTPVLTPHPLEFARLIGKTTEEVQSNRLNLAKEFAEDFGCVVLLKGASTVIASPDGKVAVNTTGNPGLAKGGSGDVLAGIIASFAAQGISPFDSAVIGAHLHGKAADMLKVEISEYGFLPSDLPLTVAKLLP